MLLFTPRRDQWDDNFQFRGVRIEGRAPVGRGTVQVLARNEARRLELRSALPASRQTAASPFLIAVPNPESGALRRE